MLTDNQLVKRQVKNIAREIHEIYEKKEINFRAFSRI